MFKEIVRNYTLQQLDTSLLDTSFVVLHMFASSEEITAYVNRTRSFLENREYSKISTDNIPFCNCYLVSFAHRHLPYLEALASWLPCQSTYCLLLLNTTLFPCSFGVVGRPGSRPGCFRCLDA